MKVRIGLYPLPRSIEQKGYLRDVCHSATCMILSLLTAGCCICSCRFPVIWWWAVRTAPSLLKVLLSIYTTLPRRPQGPAQGPPPPFNVHIKKRKEKKKTMFCFDSAWNIKNHQQKTPDNCIFSVVSCTTTGHNVWSYLFDFTLYLIIRHPYEASKHSLRLHNYYLLTRLMWKQVMSLFKHDGCLFFHFCWMAFWNIR